MYNNIINAEIADFRVLSHNKKNRHHKRRRFSGMKRNILFQGLVEYITLNTLTICINM